MKKLQNARKISRVNSFVRAFACCLISLLFLPTAKAEAPRKVPEKEALARLESHRQYLFARPLEIQEKASDCDYSSFFSCAERAFLILKKKHTQYGVPERWVSKASNWNDAEELARQEWEKAPRDESSFSTALSPFIRYEFPRGALLAYHGAVIEASIRAVYNQKFAWAEDLEAIDRGMEKLKAFEKKYLEAAKKTFSQSKTLHKIREQAHDLGCTGKAWNDDGPLPHPVPAGYSRGSSECMDSTNQCAETCNKLLSKRWQQEHALDKGLEELMALDATKLFKPLGENMSGKASSVSPGDRP